MPEADRFDDVTGNPPVVAGYATHADGTETLVGYVFLTSDLPPEQYGYSGPIEALVGMGLDGTLTGVRVTDYRESYMRQIGDFLRTPGFQEQFRGKYIGDPFRVWGDVDGIARVSISVRALSRGVRNSARRVAQALGGSGPVSLPDDPVTDFVGLSWFELRRIGVVERFEVVERGRGTAGISLAHIGDTRTGEYFLGKLLYERALRAVERRGGADHLMLYTVDGSRLRLFVRQGWSIEQDGDTTIIEPENIVMLGLPSGGVVSGEATMVGIMLVDSAVNVARPFTFVYDLGDELGVHRVEYSTQEARVVLAADAAAPATSPDVTADDTAAATTEASAPEPAPALAEVAVVEDSAADVASEPVSDSTSNGGEPETPVSVGAGSDAVGASTSASVDAFQGLDFALLDDETLLERVFADTSWSRVATMLFVLALATWAFFSKKAAIRWVSLSATLVLLGFVDGGFLSVSHITSGIWAGAGVYLRDVPLLLMVTFTVVTTLIWGRVFCGFLCPFGALQDFIDRIVPRRFQRDLPQLVHDRALYVKYGVLALVVLPALAGSHVSLYQYFEPFGTVFFRSSSLLLWSIAGAFLIASAVVPRFYCRYACPLGAALAITSLISLRRIGRVEQCEHCKVCEQRCPTGAIRGPHIDFKECVRCNVCETQLIEKRGVCRHEMEEIRPRLVQLQRSATAGVTHGS